LFREGSKKRELRPSLFPESGSALTHGKSVNQVKTIWKIEENGLSLLGTLELTADNQTTPPEDRSFAAR
jgi:hypothetical protein